MESYKSKPLQEIDLVGHEKLIMDLRRRMDLVEHHENGTKEIAELTKRVEKMENYFSDDGFIDEIYNKTVELIKRMDAIEKTKIDESKFLEQMKATESREANETEKRLINALKSEFPNCSNIATMSNGKVTYFPDKASKSQPKEQKDAEASCRLDGETQSLNEELCKCGHTLWEHTHIGLKVKEVYCERCKCKGFQPQEPKENLCPRCGYETECGLGLLCCNCGEELYGDKNKMEEWKAKCKEQSQSNPITNCPEPKGDEGFSLKGKEYYPYECKYSTGLNYKQEDVQRAKDEIIRRIEAMVIELPCNLAQGIAYKNTIDIVKSILDGEK